MNCKPGDLAYVAVADDNPKNFGRVVRVTKLYFFGGLKGDIQRRMGKNIWEFEGNLLMEDGRPADLVDDFVLKPIRDNDGTDQTIEWAGLPQPVYTPAPEWVK